MIMSVYQACDLSGFTSFREFYKSSLPQNFLERREEPLKKPVLCPNHECLFVGDVESL